jgi:GntR family transcriptional regulator
MTDRESINSPDNVLDIVVITVIYVYTLGGQPMRIRVETSSGMPITRQISAQIRAQCASKALKPGDRLPSVRVLASELAVNQNTILRVYERLTAEGLLERRHGEGTFVADTVPSGQMNAQRQVLSQQIARAAELAQTLGMDVKAVHRLLDEMWEQTHDGAAIELPLRQKGHQS